MTIFNAECAVCLHILSSQSRFIIFQFLKSHPEKNTISQLTKILALTQPTVTFHVNKLFESGIVTKCKNGRFVYCQINKKCKNCPIFK